MEFIDNNDIENFTKDGAILCRGIFSDWVDKLRIGVDKLIANPGLQLIYQHLFLIYLPNQRKFLYIKLHHLL